MRSLIAVAKLLAYLVVSGVMVAIQSVVFCFTRGPASLVYPRWFERQSCWIFGVKVIVEGELDEAGPIVYISNHISYLDIPVLGSVIKGCFVAKKDIKDWPFFGFVGSFGQTLYMSRNPADAAREAQALQKRLDAGQPMMIFPEGTSTDGSSVIPFKSSLFEIFLNRNLKIQPVTISVLEVDGKPAVDQQTRDRYTWYGDMNLEPHLWSFAKGKGAIVKVSFQKPLISASFQNRKELASACYQDVLKGLDLLPLSF